jgi:hypothetical protein
MERRLYSMDGHGRALYSELIRNLSFKAQPDGGGASGRPGRLDIKNTARSYERRRRHGRGRRADGA